MKERDVAILVFEDVEVLDFAGPFEVFSRARLEPGVESRRSEANALFRPRLIARERGIVRATGGLRVVADDDFGAARRADVLVVPGGFGTRRAARDPAVLDWIRRSSEEAELTTSVCTGALLLAAAGLLRGRRATTHWSALDELTAVDPTIRVQAGERVVEDGVVTAAGVAAGIDMALSVLARFHGDDVARETARYIEYPRA